MRLRLERHSPRLMVTPAFIILIIISLIPLIYVLGISFTDSTISKPFTDFVGFGNYRSAFGDETFGRSIANTLLFAFGVTIIQTAFGFILAVAMHSEERMGGVLRTLALLPLFTPPVAVAMIWRLIYDPNAGLLNHILMNLGLTTQPISLLGSSGWAMPAIMFADVWQWTPFCFLLLYAALKTLPKDPYEAARVDGASKWYQFKRITLPLVAPQIIVVFLFRLIIALKIFDIVYMLTFGGPGNATQVASFYIYRVGFKQFRTGYAGALSILVLIIISVLALALTKARDVIIEKFE